jgi:hypothetical protein
MIKDKITKIPHDRHTTISRSFAREPSYIEVTLYTPRQVPPTKNPCQLIPKPPPTNTGVRTIHPHKTLLKKIYNIPKENYKREIPHTHIYLFHHPLIPHD